MRKFLLIVAILWFPSVTFAHETRMYVIDTVPYEIVVGSVNEPVVVDDKTGVSLEIVRDGEYLIGAEAYLKVELIAPGTSRVQDLVPLYGNGGIYRSKYIATEAIPITYRVFGMLEGVPIDLNFSCNPGGHQHTAVDSSHIVLSEKVVQISKEGMFSCPESKNSLGFPKETKDIAQIQSAVEEQSVQKTAESFDLMQVVTFVLALAAFCIAIFSIRRSRR